MTATLEEEAVSAAHFSIDRLASLRANAVDAALVWLTSARAPETAQRGPRAVPRRALFSCMVERSLPIPLDLLGVRSLLLIDDEPAVLRSMSRLLRQAAPELKLVLVEGAKAGLAQVAALQPDAVVVDAYMPEMSGVSLCAELRGALATKHIAVLAMTADPTPELAAAFRCAGAISFFEKPVDVPALFEVLSAQLVPSAGDW